MLSSPESAAALAALRAAVDAVAAVLAGDEPAPAPLVLRATEVTSGSIIVEWDVSTAVLGWTVGRDGVDLHGSGPWSTPLTPDTRRFTFRSLRPATEYTLTLTRDDGSSASVKVTTAAVSQPPPVGGEHGPRALEDGWAAREVARDDFTGPAVDITKWDIYNSLGHGDRGLRRPSQFSVVDDPTALGGRALRVVGTPDGTTGGMAHRLNQRFGRWAARMRVPDGDSRYHPVLLTWPQAENWPQGGEIDFAEGKCGVDRMEFFLHFSSANRQTHSAVDVDVSQWHWYEVEWTPTHVRGWCDGRLYFEDRNATHFNYSDFGAHHGCIQLDWFPGDATRTGGGEMLVDAWRVYSL
jgi:hypothetical protein